MRGVAVLFFGKAVLLAFFVTPLWDVPDETGHYAIVQDLADGKGLPLPGKSVLPTQVAADWAKGKPLSQDDRWNWVAQHPPLYHLLAVPFLQAARAVTPDRRWHYRAPRLLSSISGAASLLILFAVFWEASSDAVFAFCAASAVGFLPMFSHMSSGTNHDVFLAFLCGVAALYFIRLTRQRRFSDGVRMAIALSLAGVTKLSALVVAAALLLLCWRCLASGWRRLWQWLALVAISFSLPAVWMLRGRLLAQRAYPRPLPRRLFDLASFVSYLRDYPVVDHTFKNFVGLIGWTGTGAGNVRWFQISGIFLLPYLAIALASAATAAVWLWSQKSAGSWIARVSSALVFLFCLLWLFAGPDGSALPKRLLYSLLACLPLLALPGLVRRQEGGNHERVVIEIAHAVFLIFAAAYLVNSWQAYEMYLSMRATNGRYFFAVLPFLGLAFLLPAARLWMPSRTRNAVFLGLVVLLAADETMFFLLRVIPFYRGSV